MWLLVFICMLSVVGGVPINATQEDTSHATDNVTTMSDVQKQGSVIPLNGTQNMTHPATGGQECRAEPVVGRHHAVHHQSGTRLELNYIEFRNGKGCSSYVGCVGGAQALYSAPSCSVGNVCHEIIHALGLHHEHNRRDRDQYISVEWSNIMPGKRSNFEVKQGDTQNLPYDLNSIMYYEEYYFSQDGSPTVLSKTSGVQIGQRTHLSELDVLRLNSLYHCGND
ncbi:zinc metalloproteinase nas-14-like [Pseudochaenichthys georgianus]|uniref:zinc metalloproteinase nas-14-like n=1 Tax=Pseudochaenichthys georgianus TaxID=52239 RepID=UPI00146A6271|nr:zinc metalloproteinase nas-14-like [Pseudochaenichthys georgianus]